MVNVTVNPINTINVKINQNRPQVVSGTSTFIGSFSAQQQIDEIVELAQNASNTANSSYIIAISAYNEANNKLDLTGGTITGNLSVTGIITANNEILDAGTF